MYPGNPEYAEARQNENKRFDYHPHAVVFCQTETDVINAVNWGARHNFPIRMRSGRHNYEALSNGDQALVIDVSAMKSITVDEQAGTAEIETGAKLAHVYQELFEHGYTIPGGTCPPVSIAGLTQGGGVGLLHRLMGLTCDSLLEATVVMADGQKIVATPDNEHSKLLWALKGGGGGNFGVVTRYKFRLHKIDQVSIFSISWPWPDMEKVIEFWSKWAPETDNRLTSYIRFRAKHTEDRENVDNTVAIGLFVGSSNDLLPLLEPLMQVGSPSDVSIKSLNYLDAVKHFAGELYHIDEEQWEELAKSIGLLTADGQQFGEGLQELMPLMMKQMQEAANIRPHRFTVHYRGGQDEEPPRYKISSAFAKQPFSKDTVSTIMNALTNPPSEWNFLSIHALGGEMAKPVNGAFPHRDQKMVLQYQAFWYDPEDDQKNIDWIEKFRTDMLGNVSGAFMNFVDTSVGDWDRAYYGDSFDELKQVKKKYDPHNLFKFPMSIPPADGK